MYARVARGCVAAGSSTGTFTSGTHGLLASLCFPVSRSDPSASLAAELTRRGFIWRGAGAIAGASLGGRLLTGASSALAAPRVRRPSVTEALQVLGRTSLRHPDSLPAPALPAGVDTLPQIEHVVVLMLENHSYDNFLGMLGRGSRPAAARRRFHARR